VETTAALPMFPLSAVVFPHARFPLHVFELRYQQLLRDVQAGDGTFGICLIARGSEVGGGDERVTVGTRVRLEHVEALGDGRSLVVAAGIDRILVERWLPDDPYPRAAVQTLVEPPCVNCDETLAETFKVVRQARALLSEVRDAPPLERDVLDGRTAAEASWLLCALSPLGLYDAQKLLETDDPGRRLRRLQKLVEEVAELTHSLLAGGGEPTLS